MVELKIVPKPVDLLNQWLNTLATEGYGLTHDEYRLIEDWQGQLDDAGCLSPVQEEKLQALYEEHT